MKHEYHEQLTQEFDCQVENLIRKGYTEVASVKAEEFIKHIEPLKERISALATREIEAKERHLPFVIVVKNDMVAAESAMSLVEVKGTKGSVGMDPVDPKSFRPIEGLQIPSGMAYLLVDIVVDYRHQAKLGPA